MQMNDLSKVPAAESADAASAPESDVPAASPEVFQQLGTITRQLHDTLNQLGVLPSLSLAAEGLPDARSRLNYIAEKTAEAANKVLNSVDQAKADHAAISAATPDWPWITSSAKNRMEPLLGGSWASTASRRLTVSSAWPSKARVEPAGSASRRPPPVARNSGSARPRGPAAARGCRCRRGGPGRCARPRRL